MRPNEMAIEAAVEYLVCQAIEQGFPPVVSDPEVMVRVAAIIRESSVGAPPEPQP